MCHQSRLPTWLSGWLPADWMYLVRSVSRLCGGVSGTVRARCGYWGFSVDPFSHQEITATIQSPSGNNSDHPSDHPVDHLLEKLFKHLTRCAHGARTVRIPPLCLADCVSATVVSGSLYVRPTACVAGRVCLGGWQAGRLVGILTCRDRCCRGVAAPDQCTRIAQPSRVAVKVFAQCFSPQELTRTSHWTCPIPAI